MDNYILTKQKINNIEVFNLLKRLGLKTSTVGIKYILFIIREGCICDDSFLNMNKLYIKIAKNYHISPSSVKISIKQSLDHRNDSLAKKNFESIFGYEYNEYTFTNKEFIEEIIRILCK